MAVIDLAYVLGPESPLFPIYDPVTVQEKFTHAVDGFAVRSWCFDEHSGTHVDAPAHFGEGAATVDVIDPQDLVLPAVVLDVRERIGDDHDAEVTPDDVLAFESRHGPLPERCAVLALTGWGARAHDPVGYLNADEAGTLHSPGFSAEFMAFLAEERPGVRGVGLDTASLDPGNSTDFAAHVAWLPTGRYGIENVANLDRVPPTGATLIVGVPRFQGGSGGPARVLALLGQPIASTSPLSEPT